MARPTNQSNDYDFHVETVPLQTVDGQKAGWFANRRTDTNDILGVATEHYGVVQNADLISKAEDTFNRNGLNNYKRNVIVSGNGSRMRAQYDFADESIKIPKVGDEMGFRLMVNNSFDRSLRVSFELGMLRLVCTNGMKTLEKEFGLTRKHSSKINIDDLITDDALTKALANFKKAGNVFSRLASVDVSQVNGLTILQNLTRKNVLSEKVRENVATLWNVPTHAEDEGRNLYNLYNALTQHLTSEVAEERFEYSDRVNSQVLRSLDRASRGGATLKKLTTAHEDDLEKIELQLATN